MSDSDKQFADCGLICHELKHHTRVGACILSPETAALREAAKKEKQVVELSLTELRDIVEMLCKLPHVGGKYSFTGKLRVWGPDGYSTGYIKQNDMDDWVFVPSYKEEDA